MPAERCASDRGEEGFASPPESERRTVHGPPRSLRSSLREAYATIRPKHKRVGCEGSFQFPAQLFLSSRRYQAGMDRFLARHLSRKGPDGKVGLLEREIMSVHFFDRNCARFDQADGLAIGA